jgi:quinol-cytochrome oxidoreductase complex cytochrome b subunit
MLITFYPYIIIKDILSLLILFISYILQLIEIYGLTHPDNSLEVNIINTPLHITPEWYFLHLYLILKVIPNKTSGLLLFITYVFGIQQVNEIKTILTTVRLTGNNNWIYGNLFISFILFITLITIFIGGQLPQNVFIIYGRILLLISLLVYYSNLWFPYPSLTYNLMLTPLSKLNHT